MLASFLQESEKLKIGDSLRFEEFALDYFIDNTSRKLVWFLSEYLDRVFV